MNKKIEKQYNNKNNEKDMKLIFKKSRDNFIDLCQDHLGQQKGTPTFPLILFIFSSSYLFQKLP